MAVVTSGLSGFDVFREVVSSLPDEDCIDIRCPHCGKLLFVSKKQKGSLIEVKCRGCKNIVEIEV